MELSIQKTISINTSLAHLPDEGRDKVLLWMKVLHKFEVAPDKSTAILQLIEQYGGQLKLSKATLYRKLEGFKRDGILALFPVRVRNVLDEASSKPPEFIEFWQELVCRNQRVLSAAHRSLFFDHLCVGKTIPGYNCDWEGIYLLDHPGWPVPELCPYAPEKYEPIGWSMQSLRRCAPGKYQTTVARQGTSAGKAYLPSVPTTRVGLPFGRVFMVDDVEHDVKVTFVGNRQPQGVVELGALELLTGHYCAYGMKPILENKDGSKQKLQEKFMRYLMVEIACHGGFSRDGALICGEHGTARLPADLVAVLNRWSNGAFEGRKSLVRGF